MDNASNTKMAETKSILARAHLAMRRMSNKLAHRRSIPEMDDMTARYSEMRHVEQKRDEHVYS